MVICIVALVVFGILGIFSATHREYAKQAFECVFRRITLRECESGFDRKLKMKIVNKAFGISPILSSFVYKYFELVSWILLILMIGSFLLVLNGFYNLAKYGTCDPHSTQCIFNPGNLTCGSNHCIEKGCLCNSVGCEVPEYLACEGVCDCQEQLCG